jgi:hypothetical protein
VWKIKKLWTTGKDGKWVAYQDNEYGIKLFKTKKEAEEFVKSENQKESNLNPKDQSR